MIGIFILQSAIKPVCYELSIDHVIYVNKGAACVKEGMIGQELLSIVWGR